MDREKSVNNQPIDIAAAGAAWAQLNQAVGGFSLEHSNANAEKMMALLDSLVDAASVESVSAGVAELRDFVTAWVQEHDVMEVPHANLSPVELLKHLMEANGLRQADLAVELGGQPNVSAILAGRRQINLRQAQALAHRFNLSFAAFVDAGQPALAEERNSNRHLTYFGSTGSAVLRADLQFLSEFSMQAVESSSYTGSTKQVISYDLH